MFCVFFFVVVVFLVVFFLGGSLLLKCPECSLFRRERVGASAIVT